jgi:Mor family transcriptional regulator
MKEQIIELYKQGISITQLSKQFNCHNTTIKYILAKAKLYGKEVKIHQNIINEYLNGESLTNLEKRYKCKRQNIAIVLLYNGYNVENKQNRTKFNETIFDSIDTEEKAY